MYIDMTDTESDSEKTQRKDANVFVPESWMEWADLSVRDNGESIAEAESFVFSLKWEIFMGFLILLSCVSAFVSLYDKDEDEQLQITILSLNIVLLCIFFAEFVIKVRILGMVAYYKDPFNIIDFLVMLLSIALCVMSILELAIIIFATRFFRVVKIVRLLRSVFRIKRIRAAYEKKKEGRKASEDATAYTDRVSGDL
eukprot:g1867.t1